MSNDHAGEIGDAALNDEHEKTYRVFLRLVAAAAGIFAAILIILAVIAG